MERSTYSFETTAAACIESLSPRRSKHVEANKEVLSICANKSAYGVNYPAHCTY